MPAQPTYSSGNVVFNPILGQYVPVTDEQLNSPATTQTSYQTPSTGPQRDGTYQFSTGNYDPNTGTLNGQPATADMIPHAEWQQYSNFISLPGNSSYAPAPYRGSYSQITTDNHGNIVNGQGQHFNPQTGQPLTNQQLQNNLYSDLGGIYDKTADSNQQVIDQLGLQTTNANNYLGASTAFQSANLQNQYAQNQQYIQQSQALVNQLGQYASQANTAQNSLTNNYVTQLSGLNANNNAIVGSLQGTYNSMPQLQSQAYWAGDLTSQASQAYADPQYVAAMNQGLSGLSAAANGSLDVKPGQLDPAAYNASVDAMNQYKALTTPQLTDQERFLYEKARQAEEQDQQATRAAVMQNLSARGMSGSGMQLANAQLGNQAASQNRILSDLGANAGAVSRAMAALQGYSSAAQTLNAQGNALATGNSDRRLNATNAYTGAAENADQLSFNQAYARGSAADQMAQYNRTQSIDVAEFNSNYAAQQQQNQWNRAQGLATTGLQASSLNGLNDASAFNAGLANINDPFNRNVQVLGAQDSVNGRQNQASQYQTNTTNQLSQWYGTGLQQGLGNSLALGNQQITNNNLRGQGQADVTKLQIGDIAAANAAQSAKDAAAAAAKNDNSGLLSLNGGLSVLGQKVVGW